jgi:Cft2 family RNA processing exonuclease
MSTRLRFTALGGAGEIGANSYHLELGAFPLLLDAGMHPKKQGTDSLPLFASVEGRPVEAVLISHCHLDHVGALPEALNRNPHAAIYMTPPSAQLAPKMLGNMANLMRLQLRQGGPKPTFGFDEVEMLDQLIDTVPFGASIGLRHGLGGDPGPVRALFHHAGHIAGAAGIELRWEGHSWFYTGDTCAADQHLVPGAYYPSGPVDVLHMECTAGADEEGDQRDREQEVERFTERVNRVLLRGGLVLIPAFALGRTQEMLKLLYDLQGRGDLARVPIHISGLGKAVSQIYDATRMVSTRLDPSFRLASMNCPVLERDHLLSGRAPERPCIVLATSGMMHEETPSNLLARVVLPNPKDAIFFVGYCDPDAPGARVLQANSGDKVALDAGGLLYDVRAEIARFHFSAHSRRSDLVRMAEKMRPRRVVLIHGGRRSLSWMREALLNLPHPPEILVPEPGLPYEIELSS